MENTYIINSIIIILSMFVTTESLFAKPDFSNPDIIWDKCGLKFKPYQFEIKYPKKCFLNAMKNRKIYDAEQRIVTDMSDKTKTRISGGKLATGHDSPWVVEITEHVGSPGFPRFKRDIDLGHELQDSKDSYMRYCGGVIISPIHIMTAAHCIGWPYTPTIFYGSYRGLSGFKYKAEVKKLDFFPHPDFNKSGKVDWDYDIGIIKLHHDLETENSYRRFGRYMIVNSICLPQPETVVSGMGTKEEAFFSGFGQISEDIFSRSPILLTASFQVSHCKPHHFCQEMPAPLLCPGDNGAGLIQYMDKYRTRAVLIGIHSHSFADIYPKCKTTATFIRVTHFLPWIHQIIKWK